MSRHEDEEPSTALTAWLARHVRMQRRLSQVEAAELLSDFRDVMEWSGRDSSLVIDDAQCGVRRGRGARRQWNQLRHGHPEVLILAIAEPWAWAGHLELDDADALPHESGVALSTADIAFIHPDFEWALVDSAHSGVGLLEPGIGLRIPRRSRRSE